MPQIDRPIQRSMALGEQSPNLAARADLDRWRASVALCQNCVTIPQGGATKRSGTRQIIEAMPDSKLYSFRYGRSDGYAIEAAANTFRFFRDFGVILDGPDPYELVTPFGTDEAQALSVTQSANIQFMASGARPIQKLSRFDHTDWTIADAAFKNGPFMDDNPDDSVYLYTTDTAELVEGHSFTIKAFPPASQVFTADNVGGLFLIREQDGRKYTSWTDAWPAHVGQFARWADNTYKAINVSAPGDNTGPNPPVHLFGAQWDGSLHGLLWLYCHSGWGIVQVTGYTNPGQVTVTAMSYVPRDITAVETISGGVVTAIAAPGGEFNAGGTNRWAEGAWSARRGFPRVVVLHQDRLIAYSTAAQPADYWASCTDDYENMLDAGLDNDNPDDGFHRQVNAGDGISEILWAISTSLGLVAGTTGPEIVTTSVSNGRVLKPDDVQDIPATNEGSAGVPAVLVDAPFFVSADGLRIHTIEPDANSILPNAFTAPDLTIFADHITETGVIGMAWQREPYRLLRAFRSDGTMIALTYRKDQQVQGWHRHPMQLGNVNSMAVAPSPTAARQDLWLRVTRPLAAGTKTYIECEMPFFERMAKADRLAINGWFVDCGILYQGAAITHVTGLGDFNGTPVWVFADGQFIGTRTPAAGAIDLDRPASKILVGIPMDARVRTLVYDRNLDGGANSGRKQRVPEVSVLLQNSALVAASARDDFSNPQPLKPTGGQNMNTAPVLVSGVAKVAVTADWDSGGAVEISSAGPFPMTIQAITPVTQVATN